MTKASIEPEIAGNVVNSGVAILLQASRGLDAAYGAALTAQKHRSKSDLVDHQLQESSAGSSMDALKMVCLEF